MPIDLVIDEREGGAMGAPVSHVTPKHAGSSDGRSSTNADPYENVS